MFSKQLTRHSLIHEDMKKFFEGFPPSAHPMAILSSMVASLSAYYPDDNETSTSNIIRLLAKAIDHRRVRVQEDHRAAVHVPAQRPVLLRELPLT